MASASTSAAARWKARGSPPKHRHDGTSPLPLGMDWSPPPKRWEGRNTMWPHNPQTGWSYCVTIPSWIAQTPEAGVTSDNFLKSTVFYRIHVGIQSPEGVSSSHGVLRRFSDFLKLYSDMEQESKNQPKANWDALAAKAFCEICAQEKLNGNRPTAFLSNTGYKNLERKFYETTKRAYTRKQFKYRWDAMKSLYLAWKYYRSRATGLGWDAEKMTFTADEGWWKETIEGNKLCAGFREGPTPCLKDLETMFSKAHVDGKSSFMSGSASNVNEEIIEEDDEVQEIPFTPQSAVRGAAKRSAEVGENTQKMEKTAIQKDFKRMVDHYTAGTNVAASIALNLTAEIETIMAKFVECGAHEGSEEYYMATKLFGKLENRVFFNTLKTNEERKMWLTRMYEDEHK